MLAHKLKQTTQSVELHYVNLLVNKCGYLTFCPKNKNVFLLDFSKSHLKVVLLRPYLFFGQKVRYPHLFTSRLTYAIRDVYAGWNTDFVLFVTGVLLHVPNVVSNAMRVFRYCWFWKCNKLEFSWHQRPPVVFGCLPLPDSHWDLYLPLALHAPCCEKMR